MMKNQKLHGLDFVDVTGKDSFCPICPVHKDVALIPELRNNRQGQVSGYWRCPINNRMYIFPPSFSPKI